MGAPGRPYMGLRPAIACMLGVCAAGLIGSEAAMAQSSEIKKTLSPQQSSGQTEIRKSQSQEERPRESQRATLLPALEWATDIVTQTVTVTEAQVARAGALTRFSLLLSARVPYHISYLANPYRIVVDMPDVAFQLPVTAGQQGQGLIRAYRYGLFAPGKARVVIDTTRPARVQKQAMNSDQPGGGTRLLLDLAPTDEASFLASIAPAPAAVRHHEPSDDPRPDPPVANARPVIVIDPGHGGPDPGAPGPGFFEKEVVLAVAQHGGWRTRRMPQTCWRVPKPASRRLTRSIASSPTSNGARPRASPPTSAAGC
jgi:N-acetylmuramoyl-L-alanine amidase